MTAMSAILSDPRLLNYLLTVIYALNAARWAIHGSLPDAVYWLGALLITAAVTWR
jgi:hypothetical protein